MRGRRLAGASGAVVAFQMRGGSRLAASGSGRRLVRRGPGRAGESVERRGWTWLVLVAVLVSGCADTEFTESTADGSADSAMDARRMLDGTVDGKQHPADAGRDARRHPDATRVDTGTSDAGQGDSSARDSGRKTPGRRTRGPRETRGRKAAADSGADASADAGVDGSRVADSGVDGSHAMDAGMDGPRDGATDVHDAVADVRDVAVDSFVCPGNARDERVRDQRGIRSVRGPCVERGERR